MAGRTVVITGASSGIGRETARGLAAMGARIVMVVRSRDRGEAAIADIAKTAPRAEIELVLADLYSLAEARRAGQEIAGKLARLDVLINNAGLIHDHRELTIDGFERTFALNHLAAFAISYELRELLARSAPARIVTVASMGHRFAHFSWDDLPTMPRWSETISYGTSKLCNIWFAREAARRMAPRVTSNSLHPGAVGSNFGASGSWFYKWGTKLAKPLLLTPQQGARTSIYLASSPQVANVTGEYFARCKPTTPSRRARDDDSARRLWQLSEKLCGVAWP
jgi:NAD(P)-dependent dehydrogenase (short-subunit alcohol dehydrogenase family)